MWVVSTGQLAIQSRCVEGDWQAQQSGHLQQPTLPQVCKQESNGEAMPRRHQHGAKHAEFCFVQQALIPHTWHPRSAGDRVHAMSGITTLGEVCSTVLHTGVACFGETQDEVKLNTAVLPDSGTSVCSGGFE